MSHINIMGFSKLQFYLTESYSCSYLPNQLARSQIAVPSHLIDANIYSQLVHLGFRRSGLYVYRPHCFNCHACESSRIIIKDFNPNRSQSRAYKHAMPLLETTILDLEYQQEHFDLYRKYQIQRHAGGGMDQDDKSQYEQFLLLSHVKSHLVEFRLKSNQQLVMISLIDVLKDGISSVYTFFDPDFDKWGLGKVNILWQIDYSKRLKLDYVYLGYYIKNCRKMNYKSQYYPLELFKRGSWRIFDNNE